MYDEDNRKRMLSVQKLQSKRLRSKKSSAEDSREEWEATIYTLLHTARSPSRYSITSKTPCPNRSEWTRSDPRDPRQSPAPSQAAWSSLAPAFLLFPWEPVRTRALGPACARSPSTSESRIPSCDLPRRPNAHRQSSCRPRAWPRPA